MTCTAASSAEAAGAVDADVLADEVLLVVEPSALVGGHEPTGPRVADLAVAEPVVLGRDAVRVVAAERPSSSSSPLSLSGAP